jgi:hypothetical protein
LVETHPSLSREWVGLILLPIVSTPLSCFPCPRNLSFCSPPGRKRCRTFHSCISIRQGQDRSLNLCRCRLFYPDRAIRHSRHSAIGLDDRKTNDTHV